jgi:hypothetical protein
MNNNVINFEAFQKYRQRKLILQLVNNAVDDAEFEVAESLLELFDQGVLIVSHDDNGELLFSVDKYA